MILSEGDAACRLSGSDGGQHGSGVWSEGRCVASKGVGSGSGALRPLETTGCAGMGCRWSLAGYANAQRHYPPWRGCRSQLASSDAETYVYQGAVNAKAPPKIDRGPIKKKELPIGRAGPFTPPECENELTRQNQGRQMKPQRGGGLNS